MPCPARNSKLASFGAGNQLTTGCIARCIELLRDQTQTSCQEKMESFVYENVDNTAVLMTDEFKPYKMLRKDFNHKFMRHSFGEYVRGQVHTNTVEGYFSLLKRGITGVFHHVSKKHLHRYLSEFDFRYNMRKQDDGVLAFMLLNGVEGKRLLYREPEVA